MKTFSGSAAGKYFSPLFLTFIFFSLSLYFALSHAMWRDEMQAWLIARDSYSVFELLGNTRYEGHPTLWYLLVMVANQMMATPVSMQILHVILASIAIFLFLKYSPFSNGQKLLFIFGYYPFYEYSVISRNYGIGVLLIFVFCTLFKSRQKNILAIGFTLFLLAQTNIFGLIVSVAALLSLMIESGISLKSKEPFFKGWKVCAAFALAFIGILVSAWVMSPPVDSGFATQWFFVLDKSRLQGALSAFSNAFFPIPALQQHYWNATNWSGIFSAYVFAPLAIGACILLARNIKKNIPVLCFFVFSIIGIELFLYLKYFGYWRHQGSLYIVFIASIWLSRDSIAADKQSAHFSSSSSSLKTLNVVLNIILVIQLVGAIVAHIGEQKFVFSSGKAAAQYLESNHLLDRPLVAFPDYVAPSVLGYLGDKKIFYPQANIEGSFIRWDTKRLQPFDVSAAILSAKNLSTQSKEDVIFLTNSPLEETVAKNESLIFLGGFEGAINRDENYYLYTFRKVN